jgi:exonuclease SbcC
LESGSHLGVPDPDVGSSRLADARRVLGEIVAEPADVLIFMGDLGRTATPRPTAYSIAQRALREAKASTRILIRGNHDYTGERASCLHVVAEGVPGAQVFDSPALIEVDELQIGVIPWASPSRMFSQAPHNPRALHREVSEALINVAYGLGKRLDPERPALLVGHWMVAGSELPTGGSVLETNEPLISALDLEATGSWDAIAFGHNHQAGKLSDRTWSVGPPLRTGFGEADAPTGYLVVEWDLGEPYVRHVPTKDRQLVNVALDGAKALETGENSGRLVLEDYGFVGVKDAIVRIRIDCDEEEARALNADGQRILRALVERLRKDGAAKIIGPSMNVRKVRRSRSDLTVETDPLTALDGYLDGQQVDERLRPRVKKEAKGVMS